VALTNKTNGKPGGSGVGRFGSIVGLGGEVGEASAFTAVDSAGGKAVTDGSEMNPASDVESDWRVAATEV
jgi:hypothetical protein